MIFGLLSLANLAQDDDFKFLEDRKISYSCLQFQHNSGHMKDWVNLYRIKCIFHINRDAGVFICVSHMIIFKNRTFKAQD
jgi:hypothetical protein